MEYLFKSERLGFRTWREEDIAPFAAICEDVDVMRHFPTTLDYEQTSDLVNRMKKHYEEYGYTYYAVDHLADERLIGFIGMCYQTYESPYTPCTDIGWRLDKRYWRRGLASEGATRCLEHAWEHLDIHRIIAVCTAQNLPSEKVMEKIGMHYLGSFDHPSLVSTPSLSNCKTYEILRPD